MVIDWKGNPELTEEVLLWRSEARLSFGQIAARLSERFGEEISRNQIAGFLNRNYKGPRINYVPPKKEKKEKPVKPPRAAFVPAAPIVVVEDLPVEEVAPPTGVTLEELKFRSCRWPYGDPRLESFRYCGEPRQPCGPYCAAHHGLAYRPQPQRTKAEAEMAHVRKLQMLRINAREQRS